MTSHFKTWNSELFFAVVNLEQYVEYVPEPTVSLEECNSTANYNGHLDPTSVICTGSRSERNTCKVIYFQGIAGLDYWIAQSGLQYYLVDCDWQFKVKIGIWIVQLFFFNFKRSLFLLSRWIGLSIHFEKRIWIFDHIFIFVFWLDWQLFWKKNKKNIST
jgi:hypothetical protein